MYTDNNIYHKQFFPKIHVMLFHHDIFVYFKVDLAVSGQREKILAFFGNFHLRAVCWC